MFANCGFVPYGLYDSWSLNNCNTSGTTDKTSISEVTQVIHGCLWLPSSATLSMGTFSSWAMKPMTEKMTKPANILVALLVQVTMMVSLWRRGERRNHGCHSTLLWGNYRCALQRSPLSALKLAQGIQNKTSETDNYSKIPQSSDICNSAQNSPFLEF